MAENCLYQSFTEIIAKGEGIIHNVETVKRSVKDKPKINYYSLNTNVENEKKRNCLRNAKHTTKFITHSRQESLSSLLNVKFANQQKIYRLIIKIIVSL